MKRMKGLFCLIITFLAASALAADDPVVARIGERKVLMSDLKRWMTYGTAESQRALEKDPKGRYELLRQILTGMVIAEQAKKDGFDRRPDVKENMELLISNFLTLEYLDKVIAKQVEVTEEELKQYYDDHQKEFRVPERVRTRHILIKAERTADDGERKKAREKAEGLLKRIRAGADFSKLAEEYSEDPGSRRKGGDLGFMPAGKMDPEFEKIAFSLNPGEVSDIVETDFGFHIIRCEEKEKPTIQPYAEVKEQVRKKVTVEKKTKAVHEYVNRTSKEAGIEIDVDVLVGPETGPPAH